MNFSFSYYYCFQILAYKNAFSGCYKVPRSPTPYSGKLFTRSESETKRKSLIQDDRDLPISFLADSDSMFIACQGITIHYKVSDPAASLPSSPGFFSERDTHHDVISSSISPRRQRHESPPSASSNTRRVLNRSFSHQYHNTSLYAPLLVEPVASPTLLDDIPLMCIDDGNADGCLNHVGFDLEAGGQGKFAVVLVHGFGGGVFSWRHVSNLLARQLGCTVMAFDRPGWGLTSRPRRKDWEDKKLPNPYELESQVTLFSTQCKSSNCSQHLVKISILALSIYFTEKRSYRALKTVHNTRNLVFLGHISVRIIFLHFL